MIDRFINICTQYEQSHIETISKIYMVIATFFHCVSQAIFKHAHIPIFQALNYRSFLSILLLYNIYPNDDYYPQHKTYDLILSQIFMAIGTGFIYQSFNYIPMAEATVIFQTNTIWSQFIIHLINKETLTKSRLINTFACFIGIILIVNPKFKNTDSIQHTLGCVFALTTSLTQVFCYIYVKKVGSNIKPTLFTFYFHLCMIIMCTIGQFFYSDFIFTIHTFTNVIGMVIFSLVGHLLQYRSLSLISYSKIAIYTYSSILFTMLLDYIVFNKITNTQGFIGGIIIVVFLIKQVLEDRKNLEQQQNK